VLFSNLPHDIFGVITFNNSIQGVISNCLILIMEKPCEFIIVNLIISMVIAYEYLPSFLRRYRGEKANNIWVAVNGIHTYQSSFLMN